MKSKDLKNGSNMGLLSFFNFLQTCKTPQSELSKTGTNSVAIDVINSPTQNLSSFMQTKVSMLLGDKLPARLAARHRFTGSAE